MWLDMSRYTIIGVAGLCLGVLITLLALRRHNLKVLRIAQQRYNQGYAAGQRVGWYDAADVLRKDLTTDIWHSDKPPDWCNGFQAAYVRLNNYWDKIDRLKN